jgi:hypothetical protein
MDGLGILILGLLLSVALLVVSMAVPRWRRFALAAAISPFAASIVFLIGMFILADLSPGAEYGIAPRGNERDPTRAELLLWLTSVLVTFVLSGVICVRLQRGVTDAFKRVWPG